jgi:ABC-type Zn uptake system ZnuABC Zn-binding protein ZnuA
VKILGNILCFVVLLTIAGCIDSSKELGVIDKVSYENGYLETSISFQSNVTKTIVGKFDVILYSQYIKVLKYEKDSVETYIFPREQVHYIRGH